MRKGLFTQQIHSIIQFISLIFIVIGMPSSKALMSFGFVFIIINWILEGDFATKIKKIKSNTLLKLLIIFYLLFIIGLLWSWDIIQGLKELKSRLPLLALPLIIGTSSNLTIKQIDILLKLFLSTLFVTSIFNILYFNYVTLKKTSYNIRELSYFASHIRYGLLISFAFIICIWKQIQNKKINIIYFILSLWFLFYTFYSQIISGYVSLILSTMVLLFIIIYKKNKLFAFIFTLFFTASFIFLLYKIFNFSTEKIDCSKLPKVTENGNKYYHNCDVFSEINGKAIYAYYSEKELYDCWQKVSNLDYFGLNKNGLPLKNNLVRYMTAMELKKDSSGFSKLTSKNISEIENGFTYPNENKEILKARLYEIKYEIINSNFVDGHSISQRFEYWKTAIYIIKQNWIVGVGTGGAKKAFDKAYSNLNSKLSEEYRFRSHNMFLSYAVNYGIFGSLFFILIIFIAFYYVKKNDDIISLIFMVIISISFINEDTLETQLGVTFFGFFIGLLIYFYNKKKEI